jgi:hypothetical protein
MDETLMLRIRERAYHIWLETHGDARRNWLQAEKEILETSPPQPVAAPPGKRSPRTSRQKTQSQAFV